MTEETVYLSYAEAVLIHILLMRFLGELQYGVFDRGLVESALAPAQASRGVRRRGPDSPNDDALLRIDQESPLDRREQTNRYSDRPRIPNARNGMKLASSTSDIVELVISIESDRWGIDEIEYWFRQHVTT